VNASLTQAVEQALTGLSASVVADGYELRVHGVDGDRVQVSIKAGPDACEECLVPRSLMEHMILASLKAIPTVLGVDLRYPTDS
jgi:hypothetical protein